MNEGTVAREFQNNQINANREELQDILSEICLLNANPNCEHQIELDIAGGVICKKCGGWYCD